MNVIFLDYDGVVNTPIWSFRAGKWICTYATPSDNKVNNEQAVQWLSEFCEKYGYSIVVSSTWRFDDNYKDCLRNAGLRNSIQIIGRTPYVSCGHRGDEIGKWLSEHPEVNKYLIFDDETDMLQHKSHLVKCDTTRGFGLKELQEAESLQQKLYLQ